MAEDDRTQPTGSRARRTATGAGRGALAVGRGALAVGRGALAVGRGMRALGRRFRRATHARGAGESGLAQLIELHAVNAAGDGIVAVGLAGTLFFSVPLGEARWRVALYLVLTMAPFALLAPVIGPALDRLRRGRRWAIALTFLLRAFLVVVMAEAVRGGQEGLELYPAAFGCLVLSKAYLLTRAAVTPRLLPSGHTLVAANARLNLVSLVTAGIGGPLAAGVVWLLGPAWLLRFGMLVFGFGALLAITLPERVDAPTEEEQPEPIPVSKLAARAARQRALPASVVVALRGNSGLRALSGFLTIYLAFLLRSEPIGGLSTTTALGVVVAGAGVGSIVGTTVGSRLRRRGPEPLVIVMLLLAVAAISAAALFYGLATVTLAAAAAGLAQTLGKLGLDALIQRDVQETVRASAFARSETMLQLSWVFGGVLAILLPADGELGLGVAAVLLLLVLVATVRAGFAQRRATQLRRAPQPH